MKPLNIDKLNQEQKVVLYVAGALQECQNRGFVKGPGTARPHALAAFDQLRASGFRPEREEILEVMDIVVPTTKEADRDGILLMILEIDRILES